MLPLSRLFTKTEYAVACRFSDRDLLSDLTTPFSVLMPSEDCWYADPFPYIRDGKYYVFMEMMKKKDGYAGIGVSEVVDGKLTPPKMVLDTGSHLSFPVVFEFDGHLCMMPENCNANCVRLFVCDRFPDVWHAESIILEGNYWDSVVMDYDGALYLLSSSGGDVLYGSELFLFALKKEGLRWQADHRVSLTKDSRISRMAGNLLHSGGKTYRVAQDCSNMDYGNSLRFLEILSCKDGTLSEREVLHILPRDVKTVQRVAGKAGIHTYNRVQTFEVVDFKLCTFSVRTTVLKMKIVAQTILKKITKA